MIGKNTKRITFSLVCTLLASGCTDNRQSWIWNIQFLNSSAREFPALYSPAEIQSLPKSLKDSFEAFQVDSNRWNHVFSSKTLDSNDLANSSSEWIQTALEIESRLLQITPSEEKTAVTEFRTVLRFIQESYLVVFTHAPDILFDWNCTISKNPSGHCVHLDLHIFKLRRIASRNSFFSTYLQAKESCRNQRCVDFVQKLRRELGMRLAGSRLWEVKETSRPDEVGPMLLQSNEMLLSLRDEPSLLEDLWNLSEARHGASYHETAALSYGFLVIRNQILDVLELGPSFFPDKLSRDQATFIAHSMIEEASIILHESIASQALIRIEELPYCEKVIQKFERRWRTNVYSLLTAEKFNYLRWILSGCLRSAYDESELLALGPTVLEIQQLYNLLEQHEVYRNWSARVRQSISKQHSPEELYYSSEKSMRLLMDEYGV